MPDTQAKPCPFCGEVPDLDDPTTFQNNPGPKWGALICCCEGPEVRTHYEPVERWRGDALEAWNKRPIEDALHQRIAALEAENETLRWVRSEDLQDALVVRIAALEAEVERLRGERETALAWHAAAGSERDQLRAEVERLRAGIAEANEHLAERGCRDIDDAIDQLKRLRAVCDAARQHKCTMHLTGPWQGATYEVLDDATLREAIAALYTTTPGQEADKT